MGRSRRNKPKKNFAEKRREKKENSGQFKKSLGRYNDIVRENKDFETYYKAQNVIPDDQWDAFITTIRENLPSAFRITGSQTEAKALLKIIKGDFFEEILNNKLEGEKEVANETEKMRPKSLPFYPNELAWQLQLTRKDIRRSEAYFKLHNFLIAETSSGNISRQEVVSMIPPLVLDVKPDHKVLDMCAAPGSKTAQLIEMIHADEGVVPKGFVIANDVDNNRCYMLVHQAKRLNSPNILITNQDSSIMPNYKITNPDGTQGILKFDRILADVPCSGDGTLRKNPDIWTKWSPANGNNLHGIQYRIVKRGLEMLAVGGKLVYSTCSLNPVENEAVLHRILAETGDSVQLVDGRDLVPGLKCNPGVSTWLLGSKDVKFYKSWEEVPETWHTQIRPKMFPPNPEDAPKFHLERCMRILPHHQDTGGFFVALLQKVKPLPWESESAMQGSNQDKEKNGEEIPKESMDVEDEKEDDKNDNNKRNLQDNKTAQPERKKKRIYGYREDPFVFFKDDKEDVWESIKKFYNISDELDPRCLYVRCHEGKKKNIYFTSPEIRDIILLNEHHIKMINTGVKTFVRCDNRNMKCAFRMAQEGLPSVIKFISDNRKVKIGQADLVMLLQNNNPKKPPEIELLSKETQERLKTVDAGSCILMYEEENSSDPLRLNLVGWKGTISLRAYVPISDTIHYLRLLGADCSKYEVNKFEQNRIANKANENDDSSVKADADEGEADNNDLATEEDSGAIDEQMEEVA
ncbi:GSCOCG00001847001-RA-CDS [Cotesia congregata]|uniref:tRNA (cytosine(34)-C(5))-methyltransferase n=1 Tax=Cotesia congregata TaxID=51543 RepID=A0A8J2HQN4_COTCN|nr:GSCOCG00001847001-RA-CDS [Cotesia congregata]CAG5108774.1 Similar to Nsun2: tRNA (cytosine(34)-C(5))-methyltransferase (Drosophila melanogaster) [Cotesia congregata]